MNDAETAKDEAIAGEAELLAGVIIEQAALVHRFDPLQLIPGRPNSAVVARVLAQVASVATEVEWRGPDGTETPRILWRLDPSTRRRELSRLIESNKLNSIRSVALAGDSFAKYLKLALNQVLKPDSVPSAERDAAIVAASFAADALGPKVGDVANKVVTELRALISKDAEDSRSKVILPGKLIGRVEERKIFDQFVMTGETPAADRLSGPLPRSVKVPVYLLTGLPGAGKSAFVADLVRRRRGYVEAIPQWLPRQFSKLVAGTLQRLIGDPELPPGPVALLDFDRIAVALGGPLEWTAELTRQLGIGNAELDRRLSTLRAEVLRMQAEIEAERGHASAAAFAADRMKEGLALILTETHFAEKTLLLILDTFEEIVVRSFPAPAEEIQKTLFGQLLMWADSLADETRPLFQKVRVIASGREAPPLSMDGLAAWFTGHRVLGELEPRPAVDFLKSRDTVHHFDNARARSAVELLGGHPLKLLLLARLAQKQPSEVVDEIIREQKIDAILSSEDGITTLYSRFLWRLYEAPPEGDARKPLGPVAFAGLVLREVTPELLREVIAPACDLQLTESDCKDLFERLGGQYWLVERIENHDVIRHRPEMRRLMLPMMLGKVDPSSFGDTARREDIQKMQEQALKVHRGAVEWYGRRAGQLADPEAGRAARLEAAYHQAFLPEPRFRDVLARLPADQVASFCRQLSDSAGQDVLIMPLEARSLVRFYAVGALRLGAEELAALPPELRSRADLDRMASEVRRGTAGSTGVPNQAPDASASPSVQKDDIASRSDGSPQPPQSPALESASEHPGLESLPRPPAAEAMPTGSAMVYENLFDILRDRELQTRIIHAFARGEFHHAADLGLNRLMQVSRIPNLAVAWNLSDEPVTHWIWLAALSNLVPAERSLAATLGGYLVRISGNIQDTRKGEVTFGLALAAAVTVALRGQVSSTLGERLTPLFDAISSASPITSRTDMRLLALKPLWKQQSPLSSRSITLPMKHLQVFSPSFASRFQGSDHPELSIPKEAYDESIIKQSLSIVSQPGQRDLSCADLDRIASSSALFSLTLNYANQDIGELLSGTMPELYDPVINALAELDLKQSEAIDAVTTELETQAFVWPKDLASNSVSVRDRDRRAGHLTRLVVHADRSDLLHSLLESVSKHTGDAKLKAVCDLVREYREVLRMGWRHPV